jgi:hypothetical protein
MGAKSTREITRAKAIAGIKFYMDSARISNKTLEYVLEYLQDDVRPGALENFMITDNEEEETWE